MRFFSIYIVTCHEKSISCCCLQSRQVVPNLTNLVTQELVENVSRNVSISTYLLGDLKTDFTKDEFYQDELPEGPTSSRGC